MTIAKHHGICSMLVGCAGLAAGAAAAQGIRSDNPLARESFRDASGVITTLSVKGPIDSQGAFFQSLGTNGRSCATCHVASQAMSISAAGIQTTLRRDSRPRSPVCSGRRSELPGCAARQRRRPQSAAAARTDSHILEAPGRRAIQHFRSP